MSTSQYLSCLWPGLPEIWWRGRLTSLPLAIAFAAALNLFLICGWIYPHWFSGGLFWLGTLFAIAVWLFYVVQGLRGLPELIHPRTVSAEPDRFSEAHQAYLKGEWKLAETLLNGVLAIEPRDPPALIMLCSVYRHQARLDAAEVLLDEIGRLEVADAWWIEIDAERRRLRRELAEKPDSPSESATAEMTVPPAAAA
ncbi:hypothetical protein Q31b_13590 [Novipirellula aureliae]|uniref:Tetratricopeptide repeat protein n=1 Tax=Novipirellula aureliae TaxID=2527966 RepID=A0A5C6E7A7_9BACT|nr:tetratricopeptide repeat protein [Novipirellula aureliae]TWU43827.1 hypothetical protein Q31b_13590 [Novipirellula aureliae]